MEKLATRTQLQDEIVVLSGFGEVDEFDHVGVVKLSHDLYFLQDVRSLLIITSVSASLAKRWGEADAAGTAQETRNLRTSTVFGAFLKSGCICLSPYIEPTCW